MAEVLQDLEIGILLDRYVIDPSFYFAVLSHVKNEDFKSLFQSYVKNFASGEIDFILKNGFNCIAAIKGNISLKERISTYLDVDEEDRYFRELIILLIGVSALQLFISENWSGPSKQNMRELLSSILPNFVLENNENCTPELAFIHLSVNDEDVYNLLKVPELLLISRIILFQLPDKLKSCVTINWWTFRYLIVHQNVLLERSPVLYSLITEKIKDLNHLDWIDDNKWNAGVFFNLEAGLAFLDHFYVGNAKKYILKAQSIANLDVELTGALGKRTQFQKTPYAQLLLHVQRNGGVNSSVTSDESASFEAHIEEGLKNLQLQDDTLLNKIKFVNEENETLDKLYPIEQAVILSLCALYEKSNASQELNQEELLAFINYLLSQPEVWCIQLKCLALRSKLEKTHSRKVERAMTQIQLLVDARHKNTPSSNIRLFMFYLIHPPPSWVLEKELAYLMLSLGATKSALEIFLRLELWEDIVNCYIRLQQKAMAKAVVENQLKIKETALMYCLLGDCTGNIEYYLKAWEISKHKSFRAQRSLGYLYFSEKNYSECIPYLLKSLEINYNQPRVWFWVGYAATQIQDYELSAKAYRAVVNFDAENFEAWNNLSNAYIKTNQKERAWRTLQEALKCNYEEWRIWENYLVVSVDIGAFEDAINAWHRLLDIQQKFMDAEILQILVRAVTEGINDCTGQSASRLLKKCMELCGRITSCLTNNSEAWRLYAQLYEAEPDSKTNKEKLNLIIKYMQKSHSCVTQDLKWVNNFESCKTVLNNANLLAEKYIQYIEICSGELSTLQSLASAKFMLRGVISAVNQNSHKFTEQENEEIRPLVENLQRHFEQITSQIN